MSNTPEISALRREYVAAGLHRDDMLADPLAQFGEWMQAALQAHPDDATSMTLATADADGWPAARIVLLKRYDADGFCWFTDFRSEKGQHLQQNPQAELMFYWRGLERQVRIRGRVEQLTHADGETYFHQRPRGSQLSAAASTQSHPVDHRTTLEQRVAALDNAHAEGVIPCPETWGGYCLVPQQYEFWQGRENRLHDRFRYILTASGWMLERLQP
ncbi:MAG: pyridoxamine 5'-phosphate oxidase [Oceanospirillales bacterium]|uniref:Pyridoxine/pyridoxamine 5'-phosphate oxidase n=1 Tax=Marinobacterium halophilum TaxID=267374 RepID=A0A2P8ESP8_9GAMM|nr:pyridoxamine 5'-phosphate oxidase [Marinobacterium halophilum]MBR9828293.1 pyridoxamine 5'-phosphate oxidase [Oceanospirillales bacterium]PSL12499.1 pyridoxamine 5'-phosphate oxidase [Marinobacterium halophilum]